MVVVDQSELREPDLLVILFVGIVDVLLQLCSGKLSNVGVMDIQVVIGVRVPVHANKVHTVVWICALPPGSLNPTR